jgi:hypothetical protein
MYSLSQPVKQVKHFTPVLCEGIKKPGKERGKMFLTNTIPEGKYIGF